MNMFSSRLQLPKMFENDAMARYYGLEKGKVVKATYCGGVTDSVVSYRCVWVIPIQLTEKEVQTFWIWNWWE